MFLASLSTLAVLAAPAAAVSAPAGDVTVYDASYFSGAQLSTALDLLQRTPGFTVDTGDGVRGFGGAAGNVLIDGQRATSKADSLMTPCSGSPPPASPGWRSSGAGPPGSTCRAGRCWPTWC